MHEVIYKRNDVPPEKQGYLWDERNVVLICHRVHMEHGQKEGFNAMAASYLCERHSHDVMQEYCLLAPFKVQTPLERILLD